MTYDEAKRINGEIITPSMAARILNVKQSSINDYWKRNILKKIKVDFDGITKNYVSLIEVNVYKQNRENKKNSIPTSEP